MTSKPFADQIYLSLECNLAIGTDSGSMWVIAAYNWIPQINLITNHLHRHEENKLALAPVGSKCHNLYADGGCSNIPIEQVISTVSDLL